MRFTAIDIVQPPENALYETLTPHQRISLSRKLAEALLSHYGPQVAQVAAEIGRLLEVARECERAADHFLLAAQTASRLFANEEAVLLSARLWPTLKSCKVLRGIRAWRQPPFNSGIFTSSSHASKRPSRTSHWRKRPPGGLAGLNQK
jgi:hypothetical protein